MNRNESFPTALVTALDAHLAWACLDVMVEDVEQIQVCISGDEKDVKELRVECSDQHLMVEQAAYGLKTIGTEHWMQIIIRIPRAWKGSVDLNTISGRLCVRGLTGTDFILDTVSGELNASGLKSITTTLRSVSGQIKAEDVAGERLSLRSVSGDMTLCGCSYDSYRIAAVSGRVDLDMSVPFEKLEGMTVSGSVRLFTPMTAADAALRSVSGRLLTRGVSIQANAPEARVSSVSGNLEINCSTAATYEEE